MAENNSKSSGEAHKGNSQAQSSSNAQTDKNVSDKSRSASNPSLPPKDSDIPNDGRTATGANVGAPSAPASGKPTQAPDGNSAAVENQSNPNAGLGAQVIGPTPDPVTVNHLMSEVLGDVERLLARVQNVFGTGANTEKLEKHLVSARDEAAKTVGLERTKDDSGWVAPGSGNRNQPAATSGQTNAQAKASRQKAARK